MVKIAGNVFYVTGGASGLGLATVHKLAKLGAYVALLDMNSELGESVAEGLREHAQFVRCDVRSEEHVEAAIAFIDKTWGEKPVGGVVHCGGVGMVGKTLGNDGTPFSLDVYREVIDINLTGSFNVARLIAARIVKSTPAPPSYRNPDAPKVEADRGVIILTSSVSFEEGQMGKQKTGNRRMRPLIYVFLQVKRRMRARRCGRESQNLGFTHLILPQAGVAGLALPMARDLSRYGIRVVAIAPSLFETAMGANSSQKTRENLLNGTLFPARFGKSEEFAHLAIAILENQMLNGTVIRLDGGSRMAKM
ncbi:hypothetical protein P7C70_g4476, partial [Phenoliferia sp. Uapishka_3]